MNIKDYVQEICPTTTQQWIKEGAFLLDVREPYEIQMMAFDVPKILHIPYSQFEERYLEVPKDEKVVVVCHSGSRSLQVTAFLKYNGFENVVNMNHGILRWVEEGFSVKRHTKSTNPHYQTIGCEISESNDNSCCNTDNLSDNSCCSSENMTSSKCC